MDLLGNFTLAPSVCSCDVSSTDLDNPNTEPRASEKMELLLQTKSVDELWYQHGLVYDFHVRLTCV